MKSIALICARSGSKGLPGKNIRPLAGRPLIAWAIDHAMSVDRLQRVIVSTDCKEIAAIAREFGAEVPFLRPAGLAQDDSPELLAWRHALDWVVESEGTDPDALMVVPVTAPLRAVADLERCLDEYQKNQVDVVITVTDAHRNPYFNMVKTVDGLVRPVLESQTSLFRRQDAPAVYDMTTVAYVVRPGFLRTHDNIFAGKVLGVHVPAERALDIDTLFDFEIAEFLKAGGSGRVAND